MASIDVEVELEVEECGFCRDLLISATEVVRILPCSHKFCHKCLIDNQRRAKHTSCPLCRRNHGKLDIARLPVASGQPVTDGVSGGDAENGKNKSTRKCFICHGLAISRCLECDKLTCRNHFEHHGPASTEVDGGGENTESNDVIHSCSKHPQQEVIQACRNCLSLFCLQCIDEEPESTCVVKGMETTNRHIMCSLQASGDLYRQILDEYLAQAQGLIERLRDNVKKTHLSLDAVEEKGRSLIDWLKSQEIKISQFLELVRNAVDSRVTELQEKESDLNLMVAEGVGLRKEQDNKVVSYRTGRLGEVISAVVQRNFKTLSYPIEISDHAIGDSVVRKFDEERKKLVKLTIALRMKLTQPTFKWVRDFDENGIVYWFGTHDAGGEVRAWSNPRDVLKVTASGSHSSSSSSDPSCVLNHVDASGDFHSNNSHGNAWVAVDARLNLIPTAYTLRNVSQKPKILDFFGKVTQNVNTTLQNWRLDGSTDGKTWQTIKEHTNDGSLIELGSSHTWSLTDSAAMSGKEIGWRHFRIEMTAPNESGHKILNLSGFEIYGTVTSCSDEGLSDGLITALALKDSGN